METMKQFLNFTFTITTLLMLSACANNPSTQSPSNDPNAVMTVVAATMSAMSSPTPTLPAAVPTSTPTVAPTATSMPEPTTLRVVYSRAGEIWIWNEGGEPLKLSNTGIDVQPRISSDGKIVVFARNNELYAVNPDGSDLRKIVSKEYLSQYRPADHKWIWAEHYDWMLDTHMLYFTTMVQFGDEGFPMYQFDLHRVDLDTGVVSNVLPAGQGGVPYFSPNGQTMAVAQAEAINLANIDGTNWRTSLSFRHVSTYSEWSFIPTIVPLPSGNGFRAIIPVFHLDPMDDSEEPSKLWDIPLVGEPVLLHSFPLASGIPHWTLSPSGNSIVFSKKALNDNYDLCLYHHNVKQEACNSRTDRDVYANNWALDESKYTFKVSNEILIESNSVFETTYYVASAVGPNSQPVKIDAYVWLVWVSPNQYIYIDLDWNLRFATFGGSSTLIHTGVKNQASKDGILPFDFSTR
jgi:WD40 repeat protein